MKESSNTSNMNSMPRVTCVQMAAINRYIEDNVILPTEIKGNGRRFVWWGRNNDYPSYLLALRSEVTTLSAVMEGCVDYCVGNGVRIEGLGGEWEIKVNRYGHTAEDIVRRMADDLVMFGGFALQVVRNEVGGIAELYHIDMRHLRTDEDRETFFYSEDFSERGRYRVSKTLVYPRYIPSGTSASSVYYYNPDFRQVYPSPMYNAAIKACEIERCTDDFHLTGILNGFVAPYLVNFNNGQPADDEVKEEIEKMFSEKFTGPQNAGRVMFSWNDTRESATTIDKLEVEDFGDKYQSLAKHSRQQIFTAFRANPNLFGIPTEGSGFSSEEYESAFKLFNRTVIRPMQKSISNAFAYLFGQDCLVIEPFTLDGNEKREV